MLITLTYFYSPTDVQFFLPIVSTNILTLFPLILRTGRGTRSTMVKVGSYLPRSLCLSAKITKLVR